MKANRKKGTSKNQPLTRKQLRRNARKEKKARRNDYYLKKNKQNLLKTTTKDLKAQTKNTVIKSKTSNNEQQSIEKAREKEKKQQRRLQQEMEKARNKQLVDANIEEERTIKKLEKQLKLKKSKTVPKSFSVDGLDYLLEVCDSSSIKSSVLAEQQLNEVNDDFAEDWDLMTGGRDEGQKTEEEDLQEGGKKRKREEFSEDSAESEDEENAESEDEENAESEDEENAEREDEENAESEDEKSAESQDDEENDESGHKEEEKCEEEVNEGTWEDIYGRLRQSDGSVVNKSATKYIPPAMRAMEGDSQKLERLKKQLKGFINRLAESNMHSISTQIEDLYMKNSRNDMNQTITSLILDAIVLNTLAPERLLMEHVLLIIILHANVGTEVGAHFLQNVVKNFHESCYDESTKSIENKKSDNLVHILAQLYNFKLFDSKLIYEILDKLGEKFQEKDVECILLILKSVGYNLRKDNPLELKNLILNLQKKAVGVSEELKDNARVNFMLDVLLAIKNNNLTKIPNYDTTYSEHLKKIMKGFIRKGNYISQLNISLEDLLKAEERGRWWVVGSAWTGKSNENTKNTPENTFSEKLMELARKQRMNTDTRKNIFCIMMTSEDYLDAFEKLLRLSLKNDQEREIIHVILHCCLQEKQYNPFYAFLALKFCLHDRRFQMTIKYSIWDKLKVLKDHSGSQISNLAKLLIHLFMEKGLSISVLKIIQFSELDKVTLRFMRQVLLGILLHEDGEVCKEVFEKVALADKLKMFRESLKLFVHHFLLRNLSTGAIAEDKKEVLEERAKMVDRILSRKQIKNYL